jgi:hypothetical protein
VNQRREAVLRVGLDPLPHVEHRPAGGVDQHAADRAQPLEVLHGDAEGGEDHDVVGRHRAEVEIAALGAVQELHTHRLELVVDVRVVDDLTHEEGPLAGKLGARFVGVLDRPIDPVAESELAGQPERQLADAQRVAGAADRVHHAAVVVGGQGALNGALQSKAFAEVRLGHGILNLTGRPGRRAPRP